ncbi:ABC transporter ATP-binding protein [Eremococcus coleocola]|uniref:ABC transporter, ATP-binding protein n=1 Tax=Eremococcus coleocola ACS-139-V-Col8 TaxID=908337 RepID=E4KPE2_9LACT|nr:ABC transporter ATP-binding protein [Eremococcus coleocola]EFR31397.1 ABC transporter, ATP-binding protein [Eremococcus coleocola ACS-139-V-Col8]
MAHIWRYIKREPKLLFLNFIGAIFFVLINLGLPTILAEMINEAIIPQKVNLLYFWSIIMILVIIAGAAGRVLLSYASSKLTTLMIRDLRNDMFEKLQLYSHEEYEKIGVSSLVTRITTDAFVLMQFTEMTLRLGFNTPLMFLGSIIMIFITSPSLAWILLAAMPFLIASIVWIAKKSRPISKEQQESLDQINQYARENLTGLRVIRAFSREDFQADKFHQETNHYSQVAGRLFKLMGLANPLFFHILIWMIILIMWFSLGPIEAGRLNIGVLVAFIEYAFHALFSIMMFSQLFMMYPRTNVSANRISEVLEMPISISPNEDGVTETETNGYLEFDNVTFAYPGETESPVLHNISFKAQPGQMVAFIGSTGSGKSTLVQLVPRFFDVTLGRILVDGVDVRDYKLSALRQKIGYIPQKALLFTGTISENLRYGKYDASEKELIRASDVAQASDFIERTQEKYQTFLAEGGANLSGGQKQRLSIARAIVKEPGIYVFDDSFSALDYKTDAELRRRLSEITKHSTVLVVAQRISSIRQADQIIVLNEGEIVGRGTHEQLMAENKIYQEIAASQMKGDQLFKEGDEDHA